jgi:hypothetical protein
MTGNAAYLFDHQQDDIGIAIQSNLFYELTIA